MEGHVIVAVLSVGLLVGVVLWLTTTWRAVHASRLSFFQRSAVLKLHGAWDVVMEFLGLLVLGFLLALACILSFGRRG